MLKKIIILSVIVSLSSSCVSSKIYKELDGKYTTLKNEYDNLSSENEFITNDRNLLQSQLDQLRIIYDSLFVKQNSLKKDLVAFQKKYDNSIRKFTNVCGGHILKLVGYFYAGYSNETV